MILGRLEDRRLFTKKIHTTVRNVFFISYVNSVGFKIDGSDLICAPRAPK
jgi:hypothetical protein